jgi:hypothetical protein
VVGARTRPHHTFLAELGGLTGTTRVAGAPTGTTIVGCSSTRSPGLARAIVAVLCDRALDALADVLAPKRCAFEGLPVFLALPQRFQRA